MHGSVGEFDPAKEDWSTYSARLGFYFQANGVTEADRKRAILLSCSGPETFRLARSLASPRVLNDLTYKEIGDLMEAHYNPKKSEAVQRFFSWVEFNVSTLHRHLQLTSSPICDILSKIRESECNDNTRLNLEPAVKLSTEHTTQH